LQVHEGWRAVSPSRPTQSRISLSLETLGPGEISPASNSAKALLSKDVPGNVDRLDPLTAVLVGGQIVEAQRGWTLASSEVIFTDPLESEYIGPMLHLVAVTAGRSRAVVTDGDRKKVEHQIRVADIVVCSGRSRLPRSGSSPPGPCANNIAKLDPRPVAPLERRRERDRLWVHECWM